MKTIESLVGDSELKLLRFGRKVWYFKLPEITISLFLRLGKIEHVMPCCERRNLYSTRYGTNNRLKERVTLNCSLLSTFLQLVVYRILNERFLFPIYILLLPSSLSQLPIIFSLGFLFGIHVRRKIFDSEVESQIYMELERNGKYLYT